MKRILMLLFVVAVALSFAACESENAEVLAIVAEEAPEDEAPDTAASESGGEKLTGTVVYYDGATLALYSDEKTLIFLVADDDIDDSGTRGLIAGSKADVYYTGQIKGENTAAARVTKLVQSPGQSAVSADWSVTGGVIVSADVYALSILSFSGEELNFSIGSGEIYMKPVRELAVGDYVAVFYEGELVGGDGSSVSVLKVV